MERESTVLRHKDLRHKEIVQPFIKDAFKEGAHRIKPKRILQDEWLRQIMIGVVYNDIGSTATIEEVAGEHGAFRQSIADSNKRFLRNLWNNGSPELKDRYPLEEILTAGKPLSQRSRERRSEVGGGRSVKIKAQVESGVTDVGKISKNTGMSRQEIRAAGRILKEWGVNLPPSRIALNRKALKQLEEETDDKKTQELLDKIPLHVVHNNLAKKREASQFCALSNLIRKAGFREYKKHTYFFASLRNAGVPISIKDSVVKGAKPQTLTYYILLSRHKERAIQLLRDDQNLERFQRKPS